MITDQLEFLFSDFKQLMSQEHLTILDNMYALLKLIPDGLKSLLQNFLDHIKSESTEIISALNGENVSTLNNIINLFKIENILKVYSICK